MQARYNVSMFLASHISKRALILFAAFVLVASIATFAIASKRPNSVYVEAQKALAGNTSTAILAGGCFWCVEADFEKLSGVNSVVSGYSGGNSSNPKYKDYARAGHREVVEVTYDPAIVSYESLVEYLIKHSDPTDPGGSFYDRGEEYAPAVYFASDSEREAAESVIARINSEKVYEKPLAIALLPRASFYPAEEYHQDYYRKNYLKYSYYRNASGRDAFIAKHWGADTQPNEMVSSKRTWTSFKKPSSEILRAQLTSIQYKVTQEKGTEKAFANEYADNKAEGIYVDIVSGEPLFSSKDKYDSGTGWPSFTRPLEPANIVLRDEFGLLGARTEVRSRYADSHLGHVFNDGPRDRGGFRYCMNSAALRFVAKKKLATEGYAEYAGAFTIN